MSRPEFSRRVQALAQFTVSDLLEPELSAVDAHHLFKVLRADSGEEIVVTDGAGAFAFAKVVHRRVERCSSVMVDPSPATLELYVAPLKGDRSEWALTKAVELGATRVVPLLSARVVARWRGESGAKALARWRRVATEAAGQCRRTYAVVVDEPVTPREVPGDVAICEIGASGTIGTISAVAVGPEGGWAPGEWGDDRRRIGLGEGVLRAETAAVAVTTLLASRGAGWAARAAAPQSGKDEPR